ncbi:MAG: CBS domain-containing protein, partial [Acidobacteria bacterium]
PVSEVMTPDPDSLGPDDGVAFALNRMIVGGFRHIPIVDDEGEPVAMLSQRDVVAFIVSRMPKRILNLPPDPRLEARTPDGG